MRYLRAAAAPTTTTQEADLDYLLGEVRGIAVGIAIEMKMEIEIETRSKIAIRIVPDKR